MSGASLWKFVCRYRKNGFGDGLSQESGYGNGSGAGLITPRKEGGDGAGCSARGNALTGDGFHAYYENFGEDP